MPDTQVIGAGSVESAAAIAGISSGAEGPVWGPFRFPPAERHAGNGSYSSYRLARGCFD
jgi:hypothetical protein